jgi:hypothetical protein
VQVGEDEEEMGERSRRRKREERDKCRWDRMKKKRWRKDTEEDKEVR